MTVENAETTSPANQTGSRDRATQGRERRDRHAVRVAVLAVAAAIGVAACGGGSGSPHVASLGTSTTLGPTGEGSAQSATSSSVAPSSSNDPTQLLDQWAACMRAHGDPGQADPTVDANKVIHLTWNDAIPGGLYGTNKGGQGNVGPGQYCRTYIDQAETDLQGSQHRQQPSQAQLLKFSQCMRANGVADFPDPTGDSLSFNRAGSGDLNPTNPVFQSASRLCAQKSGVPGLAGAGSPQPGSVEFNGDSTGGAGG